jgi:hypothetical protein
MAQISESQVRAIKDYLKNPNNYTIYKGKKFVDNMELSRLVGRLFNLKEDGQYFSKGIHKLYNLKKENSGLFKGFDIIKGDIYKRNKPFIEALQNDPVFKEVAAKRVKQAGKKDFFELTKRQQDSLVDTTAKVKRYKKILPKNYIGKPQLAKKLGLSEHTLESYSLGKHGELGTKYKEIFKPVVLKNIGTFFDTTNLDSKIKNFNEFRDRSGIHEISKKRANIFALDETIQNLLDNRDKNLFKTKEGLKTALKTLGKGSTPHEAASAMTILARAYKGEKFRGFDIAKDFAKGQFIFRNMADLKMENPWTMGLYDEGLRQVDRDLGNRVNTFSNFKKDYTSKMNKILKDLGITSKFHINEITSVKASFNNKLAPYAAFVDITQADINQKALASFQGDLSKALTYLDENKNKQVKILEKIERFNKTTRGKRKAQITREFGKKVGQDVRLAEIIAGTNVKSVYDPVDLEKWKKSGLDLQKLADKKGYFLDVKGARPYFELTLAEEINKGNPQFKKLIENRVGCASGCLAKVAQEQPGKITKALENLPQKARGFLSLLGRGGAKAAPLAALAAVGAAAEPLVKQFHIDDPTTYLTDESQMKGMLLATIEGETPKVDEEILKWQYPGLAAATVAGAVPGAGEVYKQRRAIRPDKLIGPMQKGVGPTRAALGIKGVLGKALGASFSPLAAAVTMPISVAAQRAGGMDYGDIATDPFNWMAPAFASSGYEMASRGIKNPTLLKALRMGISPKVLQVVSRRFGLPGLAVSAGMWGYDKWKNRSINDE